MFINRAKDGKNNLCGRTISRLRKLRGISQRELADQMQLLGLDIDKNAVQLFSDHFEVSSDELLSP